MVSRISAEELIRSEVLKKTGEEAFYKEVYVCEVDDKAYIKLHVDCLENDGCVETYDKLRGVLGSERALQVVCSSESRIYCDVWRLSKRQCHAGGHIFMGGNLAAAKVLSSAFRSKEEYSG